MALARAVLLSNDVAALTKEALDTIGDLLVMQQVQVRVVTSVCFKLHFRYLMFFVLLLCSASREQLSSQTA